MTKKIVFIIDTDSYSGNFERGMTAFMTGVIGECGVGEEEADKYKKTNLPDLEDELIQVPDEYGCHRPVAMYPTKGVYNNGMGFHFEDTPKGNKEALKRLIKDTIDYHTPHLKQVQKIIKNKDFNKSRTEANCLKMEKDCLKQIKDIKATTKVFKCPAYQSVGIFFYKKPSPELIKQLKNRAESYAKREGIKIRGFRIINEKTTISSEEIV